ncbi:hypothetical protein [Kibdelosporangium phytohabitans]|uniref:Uncharacterized protein n=1 Tax=Kibdelosporangium phytohabitans TaxID=860235 RepID=A0A0N9HP27_9PSEU|nr:hypothetical protein [Kibdelosporangium phytohabitans]ALG06330.1 hypothetical protein AOZ06_04785 [Kibdelosporangium phytohabitans]MBE1467461.1 hypothetical protein [Kibdelosporangium phytohabitans]
MTTKPDRSSRNPSIDVFRELERVYDSATGGRKVAEEEIAKAMARHPASKDRIWHSFGLLTDSPHVTVRPERLFRAHCREILDRVAQDDDTRPGTNAEILTLLHQISVTVPLTIEPYSLFIRLWPSTMPEHQDLVSDIDHREALFGSELDDLEAKARAKLADPDRVLAAINCDGMHDTLRVQCSYATPRQRSTHRRSTTT